MCVCTAKGKFWQIHEQRKYIVSEKEYEMFATGVLFALNTSVQKTENLTLKLLCFLLTHCKTLPDFYRY